MIRTITKDMLRYLPAQLIPGLVGLITIPVVTRLFQPEEYGNYVLVVSTTSIFSIIVGWIYLSIIRFYPAYERDKRLDEFYSTVLKMTFISILLLSLLYLLLLFLLKPIISEKLYILMWIGVLIFILLSCFFVLLEFLRAKRQIGIYSVFKVWRSLAGIGFGIMFVVFFHFGVDGLLWGIILSVVLALPFLWKLSVDKVFSHSIKICIPIAREIARYGFPMVGGNIAALILSLSDRYILEFFRVSREVGIYSASYAISEHSMILIASLFASTSGSIVFNLWEKEGEEKTKNFVSNITKYYIIVAIPAVVGLSVLAKPIITFLTGVQYHEGYRIIPLVVSGAFFLGLQQRFQVGLTFYNKTHFIMISIILSGLLNLGLNFLLIPKYGYIAAAGTTLISYMCLLCLIIFFSRKFFVWKFPFKTLINLCFASGIMGIIVYFVGNGLTSIIWMNLLAGILLGIIIYSGMLFIFNEIQPDEKDILRKIMLRFSLKVETNKTKYLP